MKFAPARRVVSSKLMILLAVLALGVAWALRGPGAPRAQAQAQTDYKNFEAPQVHPLALTPDGTRLLALDTPEQRLEVFQLSGAALTLAAEIPVGAEPVSVAVRSNTEAWVANWLSDSISVVDLTTGNVTRTIDVGDEPTDIVFAGQQKELAFVCVAGLRQVKVYDPAAPDAAPQVITIRGKQPRALTRDAAGARVFISVFESGNQTTIVSADTVTAAGGPPAPSPAMRATLPLPPAVGLILKWDGTRWADETGDGRWQSFVPYTLADVDVVALDARSASVTTSAEVRGVGTHVGNAVFDASANRLYVINLEARNQVRFESNLRGRFLQQRVSLVNFDSTPARAVALDLNPHVNYANAAGTDAERAKTLSLPADIVRAADGTLYVAATGSDKVGVLNAAGSVRQRIAVGQGPTGLALDETRARLYVLNRFDETLSVVDTAARTELTRVPLGFNPEPAQARAGRRFLYNGAFSAHGDVSCASCHLGGHRDGLAWDLGDPQGQLQQVTSFNPPPLPPVVTTFHPMKGPMTTQSLRGIISANLLLTTEPLHWRGDRAALSDFNPAFVSLLGSTRQLTPTEMADFTAFVRTLAYPPNPNENLDRTLPNPATGPNAVRGQQLFNAAPLDAGALTCNACHAAQNFGTGTSRVIIPAQALQESQAFKVPQLRGLYQKTGLQRAAGEQLAGFGFAHDGNFDNIFSFLHAPVFTFQNDGQRRDIEAFMMAFDTGTAPAVGLQVTVNAANKNSQAVTDRVNLLVAQANARNCDLIVKGVFNGARRGFFFNALGGGLGAFQPDRAAENVTSAQALIQAAGAGAELTFTGVPLGAGRRLGIDRDGDNTLDGDETSLAATITGRVTAVAGQPVGGVTVTLNGPGGTIIAQTAADGRYSFASLPGGAYTVTPAKSNYTFAPASQSFTNVGGELVVNFVAPSTVQFAAADFTFGEAAGTALLNVTRTGDLSTTARVSYTTQDNTAAVRCDDQTSAPGVAFARCDYATTVDTLQFAPGEAQRTISVPLIDDAHVEGAEAVTLTLRDPEGVTLGAQATATLTITDNDGGVLAVNPIFGSPFFVRQQYLDFLSREPEPDGLAAWLRVLNNCSDVNNEPACDRLTVSASFFGSQEFQLKGYFVFRFYKVAFNRLPAYDEIIPDMRGVTGQTAEEVFQKRAAFADAWVERPEFVALYPNTVTDAQYVQTLLARYQTTAINTPDPLNPDGTQFVTLTQNDLIARLAAGTLTRAQVLRAVVESREADAKEFNGAFVSMQYYGYLRRTPEADGYNNWLNYLTAHPSDFRTMVNGFMNSVEYKLRFGATQ
ncbi:MAG TPA: Calx-beta domain-containing protein [Pyrinomonadaceae bacterium]|jgi:YVTN family beta-propeller protein